MLTLCVNCDKKSYIFKKKTLKNKQTKEIKQTRQFCVHYFSLNAYYMLFFFNLIPLFIIIEGKKQWKEIITIKVKNISTVIFSKQFKADTCTLQMQCTTIICSRLELYQLSQYFRLSFSINFINISKTLSILAYIKNAPLYFSDP